MTAKITLALAVASQAQQDKIWELAPDWANYFTCDQDGDLQFYEKKPEFDKNSGWFQNQSGAVEDIDTQEEGIVFHPVCIERPERFAVLPKPNWDEAPEWATHWAIDQCGAAYWYKGEPHTVESATAWGHNSDGTCGRDNTVAGSCARWRESLCERPAREIEAPEPDWSSAPEWANYWTISQDGIATWHRAKPHLQLLSWQDLFAKQRDDSVSFDHPVNVTNWGDSLAERPETPDLAPNWDEAPDWANYWAIHKSGITTWFEERPVLRVEHGCWFRQGKPDGNGFVGRRENHGRPAPTRATGWKESLQKRPELPKPDWDNAPDWAEYWAVDENGRAYWYKGKPVSTRSPRFWFIECDQPQRYQHDHAADINPCPLWKQTLQRRPFLGPDWSVVKPPFNYWVTANGRACFFTKDPGKHVCDAGERLVDVWTDLGSVLAETCKVYTRPE